MSVDRRAFLATALSASGAAAGTSLTAGALGTTAATPAGATDVPDPAGEAATNEMVRTGADRLAALDWKPVRGDRVGVLTNPTGVLSSSLQHIVDAMHGSGVRVLAVFGPEHGFRGTEQAGDSTGDVRDPRTGLPVYDAYGADTAKLAHMFQRSGVDRLVFDIADVGARFYTYIWTMYTAMLAAQRVGIAFTVLDRPNPIGPQVAGPLLDPKFASGVGKLPITLQHGMTVGELARMFDREYLPRPLEHLDVVRIDGWHGRIGRTGLPWVPPSPNMPTQDTAQFYPGTGLFEGTLFSEGRGTTNPFQLIGAPGVDWHWAEKLNEAELRGVRFQEAYFTPMFGKHAERTCGGVRLHRTADPTVVDPVAIGFTMLATAHHLYPAIFGWRPDLMIDQLAGTDQLRRMLDSGADASTLLSSWRADEADFQRRRRRHLLYA